MEKIEFTSEIINKLVKEYAKTSKKVFTSDRSAAKTSEAGFELTEAHLNGDLASKAKAPVSHLKLIVGAVTSIAREHSELKNRTKKLVEILGASKEDISSSYNDYVETSGEKAFLADDLKYSAQVNKKGLDNLRLVYGNVNLLALDDLNQVNNLEIVLGDLTLAENKFLPNLKYVSGIVNIDGQKMTFEEYSDQNQFKKVM